MKDADLPSLIRLFEQGYPQTDLIWQALLALVCVVLSLMLARAVRIKAETQAEDSSALGLGKGGVRRLAFAVIAVALLSIARLAMKFGLQMRADLLVLATTLIAAWALIRVLVYVLHMSFAHSAWLKRFERWLAATVWVVVAMHLVGVLPHAIELLDSVGLRVGRQNLTLWLLMQGVVTVLVTVLSALWVGGMIEARLMSATDLDANLRLVFSRLAKTLLVVVAVMIGLPMVGIDLTTLSLFGGALGVGLGFGLQKIAANYVSGFILLLDRSIRIGNMIVVGQDRGIVTQITTRYSVLQTLNGVEIIVPNEVLMGSVVQNETYSNPKIRLGVQMQVDYKTDVDAALAILESAALAHPRVLADPPPTGFLANFGDSGILLELGFWIADPEEGSMNIRSDIQREVLRRFRAMGIEIPYPQREVRLLGGLTTGTSK